jgi:hypothetical protein
MMGDLVNRGCRTNGETEMCAQILSENLKKANRLGDLSSVDGKPECRMEDNIKNVSYRSSLCAALMLLKDGDPSWAVVNTV